VTRGAGRDERLWYAPFVQRLIIEIMRQEHRNRETVQRILDGLQQDTAVAPTASQEPGQYPGGANDALHPTRLNLGDTNGWQAFEPC
jgi:hypothetical protein